MVSFWVLYNKNIMLVHVSETPIKLTMHLFLDDFLKPFYFKIEIKIKIKLI